MILRVINDLVEKKANQRTEEVFSLFFDKAKKHHVNTAHLQVCECNYCIVLKVYTRMKINLARIKRAISRDGSTDKLYLTTLEEKTKVIRGKLNASKTQ